MAITSIGADLARPVLPLGEVLSDRQLRRHRTRAGLRLGTGQSVDLFRYLAWVAERMLSRLRDGRRTIGFDLDAKDGAIWVGDTVEITTKHLIDANGNPLTTQAQIIEAAEAQPGTSNRYQAEDLRLNNRYCLYTDDALPIYQQATISQRGRYGFYADDADRLDGGADPAYSYL